MKEWFHTRIGLLVEWLNPETAEFSLKDGSAGQLLRNWYAPMNMAGWIVFAWDSLIVRTFCGRTMGEKTKAPNESRKGKRIWLEEGDPKLWIFRSIGKGHPLSVWKNI